MSSVVAELESGLQAMLQLKAPGVSGSRITSLTALCLANVQSESVLVQKLYTHFKKAPPTHKLGVLYVIDSVTRKWSEQAKAAGQTVESSAADGTYAAGAHKVTELLPSLMNDIIQCAPNEQKAKIGKLIEIWEKGQTFPFAMLTKFKDNLNKGPPKSTTPEGTPPRSFEASLGMNPKGPAPTANTSAILQSLANMQRQNTTAVTSPNVPAPHDSSSTSYNPPQQEHVNPPFMPMPGAHSVNLPTSNGSLPQSFTQPGPTFGALPPLAPVPSVVSAIDPLLQQQLLILKTLSEQGVPQDQWAGIMAAVAAATNGNTNGASSQQSLPFVSQNQNQLSNGWNAPKSDARDRGSYQDSMRSPKENRFRRPSRSISPQRAWNSRDSPNNHRGQGSNDYDRGRNSPRGNGNEDRGNGGYRQRSPPGRRERSPSKSGFNNGTSGGKWVDFDPSLPEGHVKVLSRTLFVGGVSSSEQELRRVFNTFGTVQSCVVNKEKRHAFVKMISRRDAEAARAGMQDSQAVDNQGRLRSTRWGVGFGPRDCCDYASGTSIIPISKLTDADRKWMLTAEYGGTGGLPMKTGLVVEEPDIEIGQGVSSKAISRRMQTDKAANNGPKSGRGWDESPPSRFRRPDRRSDDDYADRSFEAGSHRRNDSNDSRGVVNPFPANFAAQMPGFPMPFPMLPNGMPMFPPGMSFPGMPQPPPGR